MNRLDDLSDGFASLAESAFAALRGHEALTLRLEAEDQDYIRFNAGKVRQATAVHQIRLRLDFQTDPHRASHTLTLTGCLPDDVETVRTSVSCLRQTAAALPPDPWIFPLTHHGSSHSDHPGQLAESHALMTELAELSRGTDFTGLLAQGRQIRANRNSLGQYHWFSCTNLFLDYSLYTVNAEEKNKAVKGFFAGSHWDRERFAIQWASRQRELAQLGKANHRLPPGEYRVYLAPAAVDELIGMISWGGSSYRAYREGRSALARLFDGRSSFSPLFTLEENFGLGIAPRFNSLGEISADCLALVDRGQAGSLLISSRTATEYGVEANGADPGEGLRSPQVLPGQLAESDALQALGTGLYIANLHYLNWSDESAARITGMTRYACFWVEGGEIVAPIEDLRFDESLYRIFGSALEALTRETEWCLATDTYGQRSLGGSKVPGVLVDSFRFTL